jgi:DNA gyrase subunit A
MHRIHVGDIPACGDEFDVAGAVSVTEFLGLRTERLINVFDLSGNGELLLGTKDGVAKRVIGDYPIKDEFELIGLKDGDELIGAASADHATECYFVSSDAQFLRFDATSLRAQGRAASGVAGLNLSPDARAIFFGAGAPDQTLSVVTAANSAQSLAGTDAGSVKVSKLEEFPAKGRATGGVRSHKFLRNEDQLYFAAVVDSQALAIAVDGKPIELPEPAKRDASGSPLASVIAAVGVR